MKIIYCWIIFIYRHKKENIEILLFSKDKKKYEPIYWEGKTFEKARNYLHRFLGLEKKDFYISRDVDWCSSLSVGDGDKVMYKISASVAKIHNNIRINIPNNYKHMGWYDKKTAYELLKNWKGYTRSFKKIFKNDTFWESVETE